MSKINLTEYKKVIQDKKDLTIKCKKICRAEGITQKELGEMINLSQSQISYLFTHGISIELLLAIAKKLNKKIFD